MLAPARRPLGAPAPRGCPVDRAAATYQRHGGLVTGDVVVLDCTYDNTMNNQNLVEALADSGLDAPIDVFLGEETLDEMCLAAFGVAAPYEGP